MFIAKRKKTLTKQLKPGQLGEMIGCDICNLLNAAWSNFDVASAIHKKPKNKCRGEFTQASSFGSLYSLPALGLHE